MKRATFGLSDKGKVYADNQDAFLVDDLNGIYAVADGIGGLPDGAIASQKAIETIRAEILNPQAGYFAETEQAESSLSQRRLFNRVNRTVYNTGFHLHPTSGIGTTLTVVKVLKDRLAIGHIGDSAVLLIRNRRCVQWTTDHTMEQALKAGLPYGDALQNIPESYMHALTRCIGQEKNIAVQTLLKRIRPSDWVVICSDGITQVFNSEELVHHATVSDSPEAYVHSLIDNANRRGGIDNATAIALFFE